jgi:hypothetical protein
MLVRTLCISDLSFYFRQALAIVCGASILVGCAHGPGEGGNSSPSSRPAPTRPVSPSSIVSGVTGNKPSSEKLPDTEVQFATPAFQAGHTGFTTQAELGVFLRKMVRQPIKDTASPVQVSLINLGQSQSGAALEALFLTRLSDGKPAAKPTNKPAERTANFARSDRPTVFLMGQQHGDEPATAEALLVLAQELVEGGPLQTVLDRINVVIFPRVNPDGSQLKQPMTAGGADINLDHLLLKTQEAKAVAKILQDYQPMVVVDAHEYHAQPLFLEKFGAAQSVDAMLQYGTALNTSEFVTRAAEEWFRRPMLASLKLQGFSAEWHYSTSNVAWDKTVSMGGIHPNTARNVMGLRNVVSFMIETRGGGLGVKNLKRRVQTQLTMMGSVLRSATARAADLIKVKKYVEASVRAQACVGDVAVNAKLQPGEYTLQLLNPTTGVDQAVAVKWESALALIDVQTVSRPCGYWLAADQLEAVATLRNLGLKVDQLTAPVFLQTGMSADGQISDPNGVEFEAEKGSYYVSLAQPLANLAVAALDASSQVGFVGQGILSASDRQARVVVRPKFAQGLSPKSKL